MTKDLATFATTKNTYILGCINDHADKHIHITEYVPLKLSTPHPSLHSSLTTAMATTSIPEATAGNTARTTSLRRTPSSTLSEPLQDTPPENVKTGVQAAKMGTTLDTTLSRPLEPDNYVHYSNVAQSIFRTASSTATIT